VLDAARRQPFIEGGQPIASGLALVEPPERMLIAFNAAPGTVALEEQGPYGAYAQSLAEMIRTGGLPLPEVFNRLRLRVNETTKGAQVPWDAEKVDAQFMFFDRAPDAPAQAPPDQAAAARSKPIGDLGVQDAYAAALERDSLQGYEDFLAAYPNDPLARRVRAIVAARRESITWLRTYRADTPPAYWSYLRRYPKGPHAYDARRRLAILTAPLEPPPSFAAYAYDIPPPPPDEMVYVDRPVLYFGDPDFGFVLPPPPPVFFLPPPPPDFVILAPPIVPIGLFILPQPLFVPIPVYVRPPIYVVAPPNNIIFNNIHNTTVINNVINRPAQPGAAAAGAGAALPGAAKGVAGTTLPAGSAALPPSVAQRASLIQQGKLPVPPSASINTAVKPAALGAPAGHSLTPGSPQPAALAPQALPKTNALPVPGTKGGPPVMPGAAGPTPGTTNPSAKLAPATPHAVSPPNIPDAAGAPKTLNTQTPVTGGPKAGGRSPTPPSPPKPTVASPQPVTPPPPKPEMRRVEPSLKPAAPPPPRPAAQIARPAPQIARPPPPPPRVAPPPKPAPAAAKKCPPNNPKC
jgi:uncharacterized caspase-like protein